jgi:hypothetical protein
MGKMTSDATATSQPKASRQLTKGYYRAANFEGGDYLGRLYS